MHRSVFPELKMKICINLKSGVINVSKKNFCELDNFKLEDPTFFSTIQELMKKIRLVRGYSQGTHAHNGIGSV